MGRKTPRFRRRFESFAKKPSTALSQAQEVGTKWKVKRFPWRPSQARTLACLMGGVVVEDHMCTPLPDGISRLNGVEEADELLVAVALHAAPDDLRLEHVEGGEQGGRAMPLVVVGIMGAKTALFHRQAGLGAVERLDTVTFRRPRARWRGSAGRRRARTHIAQLATKSGYVRKLELPHPMGPKPVLRARMRCTELTLMHRSPWLHYGGEPVGRLGGGSLSVRATTRYRIPPGRAAMMLTPIGRRLVTRSRSVVALMGEALLPAPDAVFDCAGPAHDPIGADAISAVQYDPMRAITSASGATVAVVQRCASRRR